MLPNTGLCLPLREREREAGGGGGGGGGVGGEEEKLGRERGRKEGRTGQPDSGPQSVLLSLSHLCRERRGGGRGGVRKGGREERREDRSTRQWTPVCTAVFVSSL